MKLIIVTGIPGTGKSSVSKALSSKLGFPLVSKDAVQCELFEKYGFDNNNEKKELVRSADNICYEKIINYFNKNEDVICDKYLKNDTFFNKIISLDNIEVIIIYLTANSETIVNRYNNRTRKERPLSMDVINVYPFKKGISKMWPPITLEKVVEMSNILGDFISSIDTLKIIKIDTTLFSVSEIVDELLRDGDVQNVDEI